jgi:hypothetical protein
MNAKDGPMTSSTLKDLLGRRLWVTGLVLAIAVGVVSAVWQTSSPDPAAATVEQAASTLGTELGSDAPTTSPIDAKADRGKFHADMKAARQLKGKARVDAIKKAVVDAKARKHGAKVEKRAERRADRRAAVFALLPDELQADLKKLRAMDPGEERRALRADIREKALAGGYGDKVQQAAEKLKGRWKD